MAEARFSGKTPVAIVETFPEGTPYRDMVESLPSESRANVNTSLVHQGMVPSGVFIGGTDNYKLFVEDENGTVIPFLNIAGGIIHPISCAKIRKHSAKYTTDAPNVVVLY